MKRPLFLTLFALLIFPSSAIDITIINPNQINENLTWGQEEINLINAWQITKGDPDIIVAVIDTGIDLNHPDLSDQIWINNDEIPNNDIDDDNNGFIDDINGYNFVNNNSNLFDDFGHGTHVSGTIASSENGIGLIGVAPKVTIMPLKVFNLSNELSATNENIARAIIYAVDNGAKIISMSLGGPSPTFVTFDAIDYASENDVLLVAASGNDGSPYIDFPAGNLKVISVGSIDENLDISLFSNFGAQQELVAPGEGINSTLPGAKYGKYSGTSMSAPHVSGAAALIYSILPDADTNTIRFILQRSAKDLGIKGWDIQYGSGLIDIEKALLTTLDVIAPTISIKSINSKSNELIEIEFSTFDEVGVFQTSIKVEFANESVLEETVQNYNKIIFQNITYQFNPLTADRNAILTIFSDDLRGNQNAIAVNFGSIIDVINNETSTTAAVDESQSTKTITKNSSFQIPWFSIIILSAVIRKKMN